MAKQYSANVLGEGGLSGQLVDPIPPEGESRRIRLRLDDGRLIEIPSSLLSESPDGFRVNLHPEDIPDTMPEEVSDQTVIPVLAEELVVGRKAVPTGGVRVFKNVREHEELLDIPLLKEHVDVRRVVIDRPVDGPMPVRREGETTIIPIVEEVLVVEKRLRLKEEIHVTRRTVEERHQETVSVKHEEARIEHLDSEGRGEPVSVPATPKRVPVKQGMAAKPRRKGILTDR